MSTHTKAFTISSVFYTTVVTLHLSVKEVSTYIVASAISSLFNTAVLALYISKKESVDWYSGISNDNGFSTLSQCKIDTFVSAMSALL